MRRPKHGNDIPEMNRMTHRVYESILTAFNNVDGGGNYLSKDIKSAPDAYTKSIHNLMGMVTGALPNGKRAGVALTDGSLSAMPGTDVNGPTALVMSAAKAQDAIKYTATHMNVKLPPDQLKTRKGRDNVLRLVKTLFDNDGYHIQFNVLDTNILRDAQKHPENYRDLVVRVAGFSAFFTKLAPGVQNEVIERTLQSFAVNSTELQRNRCGVPTARRMAIAMPCLQGDRRYEYRISRSNGKLSPRRIAINVGAGFVPGINAVVMGAALAAGKLGWELVGIRDGFDGLLHPERYPDGGLLPLGPQLIGNLDPAGAGVLGQSGRVDPFHVRTVDADGMVEEVDMSDELLKRLKAQNVDALISVVGGQGLSILYKLQRKGLNAVCVPRAIENDVAATLVSFGFNSALSFTIEMLDKARQAAQSARKIAVVEVLGAQAGWLALQAGIAACADAVLIPEIPCDLKAVAASLKEKITPRRPYGLVVVAEGREVRREGASPDRQAIGEFSQGIAVAAGDRGCQRARHPAIGSGRRDRGEPAAVADRRGNLSPRAGPLDPGRRGHCRRPPARTGLRGGAIRALSAGNSGVMVAFVPPDIKFVPLAQAINKVRTVPAESEFIQTARSLGICLGRPS